MKASMNPAQFLLRFILAMAIALSMSACETIGAPAPKSFKQSVPVAVATVTSVRQSATALLQAGKITPKEASNVQLQADNARTAIDLAQQIHATDPAGAQTKLTAALLVLSTLNQFLMEKSK